MIPDKRAPRKSLLKPKYSSSAHSSYRSYSPLGKGLVGLAHQSLDKESPPKRLAFRLVLCYLPLSNLSMVQVLEQADILDVVHAQAVNTTENTKVLQTLLLLLVYFIQIYFDYCV